MKISETTLMVLKNFNSICSNLAIQPGNVLKTVNTDRSFLAVAKVEDDFTDTFGIYDLGKFLSVISLFDSPILDFKGTHVNILETGGRKSVRFLSTDIDMLNVPKKDLNLPDTVLTFTMSAKLMTDILKASNIIQLPHIVFRATKGSKDLNISVMDYGKTGNEDASNRATFLVEMEKEAEDDYVWRLSSSSFKMIPGNYEVSFAVDTMAIFTLLDKIGVELNYYAGVLTD